MSGPGSYHGRTMTWRRKNAIGYKDAGVNIDEADRAVSAIREHGAPHLHRGVLTDIGSFGGGFRLQGFRDPVLVSSADGVGTKLKLAFLTGRHSTIGEDLVNHCVNDIAVQGAMPLFFLDYFAVGKLDARVAAEVVSGIARGCRAQRLRADRRRNRGDARLVSPTANTIWPASSSARWSASA